MSYCISVNRYSKLLHIAPLNITVHHPNVWKVTVLN